MDKDVAIARLQLLEEQAATIRGLYERVEAGEPPDRATVDEQELSKWRDNVRAALRNFFPNAPQRLKDFEKLNFSPGLLGATAIVSSQIFGKKIGDLKIPIWTMRLAEAQLGSCVDEVRDFWPEPGNNMPKDVKAAAPSNTDTVFVIHGHQLLHEFHAFLRSIGLKPLEWSRARNLTGKPNPYTWEIVDNALRSAGAVVALMTPDDEARLSSDLWNELVQPFEREFLYQPRQNVLFEAGVAYGRAPERTVLIRVGSYRPMTDLAGHHILQLDNSAQSRQAVADALKVAGCSVDLSGSDWFKAGDFAL